MGSVVGIDLDDTKIDIADAKHPRPASGTSSSALVNVMDPDAFEVGYDFIYVRFVLTHLTDPAGALANLTSKLVPGGVLVVEDIDFTGHFCHPDSPAFRRYVEWYSRAVQLRGADPNIGPRLPGLLSETGLDAVEMNVVQPAGTTGEVKLISPITLEAIADAVLAAEIATPAELDQTVDELYAFANTDGTVLSLPRIVQAWGRTCGRR